MLPLFDVHGRLEKLNGWGLEGNTIVKNFTLRNFKASVELVNKVAEISERHDHHPQIIVDHNVVKLRLTTHQARGLTEKDFSVAGEIDKLRL